MLVHLMENYLRAEQKKLREDKHLNDLVVHLRDQNRSETVTQTRDRIEPPMIPNSSDQRTWNDYLQDRNDLSRDNWDDISGVEGLFGNK